MEKKNVKNNTVIGKNKYGRYCVPISSATISPPARKVLAGDVYEPKTIEYIINNCGDGDIVHAGAYFGDFLPALSTTCKGIVWTFEAKQEHITCAWKTIMLNGLTNVQLYPNGLGERAGLVSLQVIRNNGVVWGGGSRIRQNAKDQSTEQVAIVALDTVVVDRNISIIHYDIEGYEQQALIGSLETIRRCLPILIIETLPNKTWLEDNLFSLGYKIVGKVHQNTILRA